MENSPLALFEHEKFGSLRVVERKVQPWFVAKDVCDILEMGNPRSSLALLDEDEKGVHSMDTPGGKQEMTIISEPGLYSLILRSRKPEAKAFKRWVTHDILPSIRKTGAYVASTKESPRTCQGTGAHAIERLSHQEPIASVWSFNEANVLEPHRR
nr:MAG TPA: repressor domain protein [Caudoviricetes sp.]